jgi:hypothetical protein
MALKEIRCEGVNWILVVQDVDCGALCKEWQFIDKLSDF